MEMTITDAIASVSKAIKDVDHAKCNLRLAIADLSRLNPHKPGDDFTHGRYGKCRIFAADAKPHGEYGALWQLTLEPYLKSGKPGTRKVSCLLKIQTHSDEMP